MEEKSVQEEQMAGGIENAAISEQWVLPLESLEHLWYDVYPRIIGKLWLDHKKQICDGRDPYTNEEGEFYKFFKDPQTRRSWFKSMWDPEIDFPEGLEFEMNTECIKGGTISDFILTSDAMYLPWPEVPKCEKRVYRAYITAPPPTRRVAVAGFGGAMQRQEQGWWGTHVWQTVIKIPALIAQAWLYPEFKDDFNNNAKSELNDTVLPENLEVCVNEKSNRIILRGPNPWEMEIGLPRPPSLEKIFTDFANGRADNPLYTSCGTG